MRPYTVNEPAEKPPEPRVTDVLAVVSPDAPAATWLLPPPLSEVLDEKAPVPKSTSINPLLTPETATVILILLKVTDKVLAATPLRAILKNL